MSFLKDKSVLITGGTGSFGKAFVKKVLEDDQVSKLVVFSRDELKQFEMAEVFNSPKLRYFLGDIRDKERLMMAMRGVPTRPFKSRWGTVNLVAELRLVICW